MSGTELDQSIGRKLILIDDDPVFGNIMAAVARARGIELHYYTSLLELGYIGRMCTYDAAIVDYDLGELCGLEIGEYMTALLGDMPMLLVSGVYRGRSATEEWSKSIKAFMPKSSGHGAIVEAVCNMLDGSAYTPASAVQPAL